MIFRFTKKDGTHLYWKGVNAITNEFEFTKNRSEALHRSSGYYADAESDFIQWHVAHKEPELVKTLKVMYEEESYEEEADAEDEAEA